MKVRAALTLGITAVAIFCISGSASAAECGAPSGADAEPGRANLTLRPDVSDPNEDFGRRSTPGKIILVFDVAGCELVKASGLTARVVSSDVPSGAFDSQFFAKGSLLTLELAVNPVAFDPGDYKLFVAVSGPDVVTTITGAGVKRTEHRQWIPWGVWLAGVIAGVLWAGYTIWLNTPVEKRARLRFQLGYLPLSLVTAFGGSYLVIKQAYLGADVWRWDLVATGLPLFFGAAAAAAGGSTTGPLAKAFIAKVRKRNKR